MKYIDSAKCAIQEGEPERAIALLREFMDKNKCGELEKENADLILIGSRFSLLKTSKTREVITYEIESQEINKINQSLLNIISELENKYPDTNNLLSKSLLMNIPRNAIADNLYYGFLIFGCSVGLGFLCLFFYIFYQYIQKGGNSVHELLFIGSTGVLASCFLIGSYEGMNRKKGLLVNWKIVAPHLIIAFLMLILAALLTII